MELSRLGVKKGSPRTKINKHNKISSYFIATCSSFIQTKRIDLLIKAFSILSVKCKSKRIEWHHIGGGRRQKYFQKKAMKTLSTQFGFKFHGVLRNEEIFNLYKNQWFDLFVNVSDSEGIPVSIMEAMSFGIPVIARNVGGISEIVNNDNGMLLDEIISPERLAEVLLDAIHSEDEWRVKRRNALDTWKTNFNADINYGRFIKSLMQLKT